MASTAVQIADAVAAELNGHAFSVAFTAERRLLPSYELKELDAVKVTVVPRAIESQAASRTLHQCDHQVDVGVQKKLTGEIDMEVPPLMALVEEIVEFLARRKLAAVPDVLWLRCANDPIYSPQHLNEQRTFVSVLTLTYRVMKA